jgi:hypothetical protein
MCRRSLSRGLLLPHRRLSSAGLRVFLIAERLFPLSEASQVFERALQGHTRGKIAMRVEDEKSRG